MTYDWDEAKNRSNFAKHGFDFADAEQVLTLVSPSWTTVSIMERNG
jgi:uncharacterized DUF497 family protein